MEQIVSRPSFLSIQQLITTNTTIFENISEEEDMGWFFVRRENIKVRKIFRGNAALIFF